MRGSKAYMSEGEDGETIGASPDPGRGQEKSEQGQAGNGLDDVGSAEHRLFQQRPARDQNAEWNADQHGEKYRRTDQPEMFGGEFEDFDVVLSDELQNVHELPRGDMRVRGRDIRLWFRVQDALGTAGGTAALLFILAS